MLPVKVSLNIKDEHDAEHLRLVAVIKVEIDVLCYWFVLHFLCMSLLCFQFPVAFICKKIPMLQTQYRYMLSACMDWTPSTQ